MSALEPDRKRCEDETIREDKVRSTPRLVLNPLLGSAIVPTKAGMDWGWNSLRSDRSALAAEVEWLGREKPEGEMDTQSAALPRELVSPVRILDSQSVSGIIRVFLQTDAAGVVEAPVRPRTLVAIHVGRPVRLECRHGDEKHSGLAIHGDIDDCRIEGWSDGRESS